MCKASELAEIQHETFNEENKVDLIKFKMNEKFYKKGLSTKKKQNKILNPT